ncbi:tRNA-5-methyluridine(54) 2-sulfurtransferase [Candidatus Methanoperedenaceae archaeon GB37]|nr:tRNA-5-methyluridine(54) 2-sulfurtransferase [Candidatus Methanoperedenaceae archaeon GB37]
MKCDRCNRSAIIFQRYSSAHLCKHHFKEDVERKIKRDIRKYRMVEKNDTIAVALSGGKDSSMLLYILHKLFSKRRDTTIVAISIDEGIQGYRKHTLEHAYQLTRRLGATHIVKSFRDTFGADLDTMVESGKNPCSICGVLRKNLLNSTARELGATKLAIGHNLDDEAQTILMNYLHANIDRITRMIPEKRKEGLIPRIKPLRSIPEREVALYAITTNLPLDTSTCPYAGTALRNDVRDLLNNYETAHPGTKYALLTGSEKIAESLIKTETTRPIQRCEVCGEPTGNNKTCKTCEIQYNIPYLQHK